MGNNEKQKNNELIALRFKEMRTNYFHGGVMKAGKKSDHTQDDFGEFLGVDGATIRNYEKGRTPIPYKHLQKLASEYNISIEYLLGEDDFHTLEEKRNAINKKRWNDNVIVPMEISSLMCDILERMGYVVFEDNTTGKDFLTADFEIPAGHDVDLHPIPEKDIIESFKNTAHIRIQRFGYIGIKRKKDGQVKYILNSRLNDMFDDIESYIKYRIEREFNN